jgi:uncharacterized membrane protein YgcG
LTLDKTIFARIILTTIKTFMKKLLFFLPCLMILAFILLASGCEQRHYTKKTNQTVKVYKVHNAKHVVANTTATLADSSGGDEWLYYYIMFYNNNYYYYSSPSLYQPSSYSTFNWSSAKANPIAEELNEPNQVETVAEETVPNTELGQTMETTIDTTEQQISDMVSEGNPNTGESSGETSSGGESSGGGSSDSGSSSSGGDSGGGGGDGGGDGGGGD